MDAHCSARPHRAFSVPEVLLSILAHVDDDGDADAWPTLVAAAQVCSSWADAATRIIWRAPPAAALAAVRDAWRRRHYYAPKIRELVLSADDDAAIAHYECAVGRHAYDVTDAGHAQQLTFPRLLELVFDPGALAADVAVNDLERLVRGAASALRVLTWWEFSDEGPSASANGDEEEGEERGEKGGRVARVLALLRRVHLPVMRSLTLRTVNDDVPTPASVLEFLETASGPGPRLTSLALTGTMQRSVDTAVLALLAHRRPKLGQLELDYRVTLADTEALMQATCEERDADRATEATSLFAGLKELGLGVAVPAVVAVLAPAIHHIVCLTLRIHGCDHSQPPPAPSLLATWAPHVVMQALTSSLTALKELALTFYRAGVGGGSGGDDLAINIDPADLLALRRMPGLRVLSVKSVPPNALTLCALLDADVRALVAALPRLRELCLDLQAPLLTWQSLHAVGVHCPLLERLELFDEYDLRYLGAGAGVSTGIGTGGGAGGSSATTPAAGLTAEADVHAGDEAVGAGGTTVVAPSQPLFAHLRALRLGAARVWQCEKPGDP
jgi:hypothetical protein